MTNPPYNKESTCPACGYDGDEFDYAAGARYIFEWPRNHIRRECNRCGYKWSEAPLNQEVQDD